MGIPLILITGNYFTKAVNVSMTSGCQHAMVNYYLSVIVNMNCELRTAYKTRTKVYKVDCAVRITEAICVRL